MYKKVFGLMICVTLLLMYTPVKQVQAAEITRLIIESYEFEESEDTEGVYNLTLHIRNTSNSQDVWDALFTLNGEQDAIYPVYGESNQKFIKLVAANTGTTLVYRMKIAEAYTEDVIKTVVTMQFVDENNTVTSNTFSIYVPNSGKLTFDGTQVSINATVNTKTRVAFTCQNQVESIDNLQFILSGEGLQSEVTLSGIGLMKNQKYNAEMYVVFKEAGRQNITLSYQYTGKDGSIVIGQAETLTAVVGEAGNGSDGTGEQSNGKNPVVKQQIIQISAITVLIIASLVILLIEIRNKDRR